MILGSGPNRIGQGVEFDYCCVHAVQTYRELGYEAVMVNCNPETVSTDYDTSNRLYFEPLDAESVLAICEREQPDGVVIQFGGQTPLKLARAIEAAGFAILGTPFDAVDLAEDRQRFGKLLAELGIRCPDWGIARSGVEAAEAARRIGYPVLVRPSYVLGGRAMRVCHTEEQVVEAFHGVHGPTLVDRFLEYAIEIDVDALCDGESTYVGAIMQHVEEAGVHSGDSACVLPAQSLGVAASAEISSIVKRLGPALGVVGLLNVQLAVVDDVVFVLEVNPRASRTVPFASKATGVNLVAAACRLAAGERLADLGLPAERPPRQVSVKAAVLPFARFPGADPVLGPEMRATGEVMASASDLPTAFAKAERAAGRPLPRDGVVFLSVRDDDKAAAVPVAAALVGLGFQLVATAGHGADAARRRARRRRGAQGEHAGEEPSVVDLIRPRALQPRREHARRRLRAALGRLPDPRGGARGADPLHHDDRGRRGGRARDRERARRDRALPPGADRCRSLGASVVASRRSRRSGRTRSSGSTAAGSIPGFPASSSCSRRPAGCCRGRCRSASRRAGELGFLLDPIGPGTRALAELEPGEPIHVFGPLGNGFRLDVDRPLLVGGGIGVAPFPYLSEALEQPPAVLGFRSRAARRSGRARSERRGRDRPGARHRCDAARPRRARVRARADARGGPRALPGRAARLGGADGLRLRRVLRLRRRDRRRAEKVVRRRTGAVLLLNASGCLDALTAPDVAAQFDAFVTKTVTPEPREGNAPVRIAETEPRDAQLDRAREPGPRSRSSAKRCRVWLRTLDVPLWVSVGGFCGARLRRDVRATARDDVA